ncbi:hypothetical protein SELMODRAFT_440453 [Selaginella moellendorffii]|uniref:Granulins domain-containing protein n=1 Tax=Selaginella moellendorffii TaxID=88036 RepID=D8RBW6_SELML|nr:uncharacterized protein LOC9650546 [Selaginella moellendorffii]EFJ30859.1 hypothetical protein SELMODRAFT_440453 [Selaginella moellendorffii]|eukprot:XP_002968605.1 uncharacterized protein LOC9650546 [Selaginella moellendorffii]
MAASFRLLLLLAMALVIVGLSNAAKVCTPFKLGKKDCCLSIATPFGGATCVEECNPDKKYYCCLRNQLGGCNYCCEQGTYCCKVGFIRCNKTCRYNANIALPTDDEIGFPITIDDNMESENGV